MTNDNLRGLPAVSPWDVLDAATRGEEWVTFGELKRAREQLATDLAAAIARAEAAERDAERYQWLRALDGRCDGAACVNFNIGFDWIEQHGDELDTAIDAAIAAQQAEGEDRG